MTFSPIVTQFFPFPIVLSMASQTKSLQFSYRLNEPFPKSVS